MKLIAVNEQNDSIRERFFKAVFGNYNGYVAFAAKDKEGKFSEAYFQYPQELPEMLEWVNSHYLQHNLYFCSQLLKEPKRTASNVSVCPNLWADLDETPPQGVEPRPSIALESSPGRWQSFWILKDVDADPHKVEGVNKKLTYAINADPTGWDLSQLLRIPLTYNFKHGQDIVRFEWLEEDNIVELADFDGVAEAPKNIIDETFPEDEIKKLPDVEKILHNYRHKMPKSFRQMYTNTNADDRSGVMWAIESLCLEAGMTLAETYKVAFEAPVNKYLQDNRNPLDLWREVCKAKDSIKLRITYNPPVSIESLLTEQERNMVSSTNNGFIQQYVDWAKTRTDAAPAYHEAGAFIILSSLLSESLELPMSFGMLRPNLWFMILGDTTLTRKTTSMEMAIDTINTIQNDTLLATDGSVEGIMSALAQRPHRVSLFVRDEISGLVDSMKRKDYLAGLVEAFCRWYDGKTDIRQLKKETIEVRDPRFIIFAGGIKSRITELLDKDYIINGFVPRFLFITAEASFDNYRPPTLMQDSMKETSHALMKILNDLKEKYSGEMVIKVGNQDIASPKNWEVGMTQEALDRYAQFEHGMSLAGASADEPELYSPTLDRMAKSGLKIAMLLAAERCVNKEDVVIELEDMLRAIYFIDRWKQYTLDIIDNAGKGTNERHLERAFALVKSGKESRSELMRSMHLTAKEADWILETLEQRGLIIRSKYGKLEKIYATAI